MFRQPLLCILTLNLFFLISTASQGANLSQLFSGGGGGTLTFSGYAGPFDGNLGGLKGANQKCNSAYSGSHVCLYPEIVRLGNSYPYTHSVWQIDGIKSTSLDGGYYYYFTQTGQINANNSGIIPYCSNAIWASNSASYVGPALGTLGAVSYTACSTPLYLACCK